MMTMHICVHARALKKKPARACQQSPTAIFCTVLDKRRMSFCACAKSRDLLKVP